MKSKKQPIDLEALMQLAKNNPQPTSRKRPLQEDTSKFRKQLAIMQARRAALIPIIGLPDDDAPMQPQDIPLPKPPVYKNHPVCGHKLDGEYKYFSRGLIYNERTGGQKSDVVRCEVCAPDIARMKAEKYTNKALSTIFADAAIPAYGRDWTFDTFPLDSDARDDVENWVVDSRAAIKSGGEVRSLYLYGLPGAGKTGLAISAARQYLAEGYSCLYVSARGYFNDLQASFNDKTNESLKAKVTARERLLNDVFVLVFDDLGSEYQAKTGSEWAIGKIFDLIEARAAAGLVTIITSNDSVAALNKRYKAHTKDLEVQTQIGRVTRRLKSYFDAVEVMGGEVQ